MFPADLYIIRLATEQDAATLRRLAALDSATPLTGRVLIGEIDGKPAAALSLKTGVADRRPVPGHRAPARPHAHARLGGRGDRPRAVAARADARRGAAAPALTVRSTA